MNLLKGCTAIFYIFFTSLSLKTRCNHSMHIMRHSCHSVNAVLPGFLCGGDQQSGNRRFHVFICGTAMALLPQYPHWEPLCQQHKLFHRVSGNFWPYLLEWAHMRSASCVPSGKVSSGQIVFYFPQPDSHHLLTTCGTGSTRCFPTSKSLYDCNMRLNVWYSPRRCQYVWPQIVLGHDPPTGCTLALLLALIFCLQYK